MPAGVPTPSRFTPSLLLLQRHNMPPRGIGAMTGSGLKINGNIGNGGTTGGLDDDGWATGSVVVAGHDRRGNRGHRLNRGVRPPAYHDDGQCRERLFNVPPRLRAHLSKTVSLLENGSPPLILNAGHASVLWIFGQISTETGIMPRFPTALTSTAVCRKLFRHIDHSREHPYLC